MSELPANQGIVDSITGLYNRQNGEIAALRARAEQAERERDEALAAAERARAEWHPTSIRAAWDKMESLKARVLALAEEWEGQHQNSMGKAALNVALAARALREAVEGGGK